MIGQNQQVTIHLPALNDPAVAVAAYGAPAILMTGDANDLTNHGNGGALVVTGTPTDTDAP